MRRFAALLACVLLLFCGCGVAPQPLQGEPEAAAPAPREIARRQESVDELSYVQGLALDIAGELLLRERGGEEAVRTAYCYLVENVYFADPVGLDAWRYLSDETRPIPFLENRGLSPLLFQIGSCEDFAAAMVLLLRAGGFSAEYVAGYTLSVDQVYVDHAWAVVELDGVWYHLDPQLEQNVTKNGRLTYRFYLRSDQDMQIDHKWGESLIDYWSEMPEEEKRVIREQYTPPACPLSRPKPNPEIIPMPPRPNMADVEARMRAFKAQSGRQALPPMRLNVEPPVLVAGRHITPPLAQPTQPTHYGRGFLQEDDLALYDALLEAVQSLRDGAEISIPMALDNLAAGAVIETFLGDYPEYYWADFLLPEKGENRALRLRPAGALTPDSIAERSAEIEARADGILAETAGKSEFQTALTIHDYLAGELSYDTGTTGPDSGNIYGALVEGFAFCDGYARGFQYLAERAGLETVYVKGSSLRGVPHAWNAVRLGGDWYYLDVTWDRPRGAADDVYHDYFLISLEDIGLERVWDQEQYPHLPETNPARPGYYERVDYAVGGRQDRTSALADAFYRQLSQKRELAAELEPVFLEVQVLGDREEYLQWKEHYIKQIFSVLTEVEARARGDGAPFTISYDTSVRCDFNDTMQVLTFYPKVKILEESAQ